MAKVNIDVYADHHGAPRKLGEVEGGLDKVNTKAGKTAETLRSVGKAMTVMGAAVVAGLGALVSKASDAQEITSRFGTVFSDVMGQANEATRDLAENYGLSTIASQEMLSATGDLLTGLGLTGQTALDLSQKTQQLAVDLASFTNYSEGAKGASDALTKAMLGERESVKALGIVITEEMVKEKLLAEGKEKLKGQTLLQAKAEATLAIAMEQSKNAIGDYERTSGSLANKTRELKARTEDLMVEIGTHLIPVVTDLAKKATEVVKKITDWAKAHPDLIKQIVNIALKVGALMVALGPVLIILPKIITAFGAMKTAAVALTGPIGLVTAALALIAVEAIKAKKTFISMTEALEERAEVVGQKMGWLKKTVHGLTAVWYKHTQGTDLAKISIMKLKEQTEELRQKQIKQAKAVHSAMKDTKLYKSASNLLGKAIGFFKDETKETVPEVKKLKTATKETKEQAKAWADYLKSVGIKSISQKKEEVKKLEDNLKRLTSEYKDGKWEIDEYKKAVDETKKRIKELSGEVDTMSTSLGTASQLIGGKFAPQVYAAMLKIKDLSKASDILSIKMKSVLQKELENTEEAFREMKEEGEFTSTTIVTAADDIIAKYRELGLAIPDEYQKIHDAAQETTETVNQYWDTLTTNMSTAFGSLFESIFDKTRTAKEKFSQFFSDIKSSFLGMITDMISDWINKFINKLVTSAASGAESVASTLGQAAKDVGSTVSKIGESIGTFLSGVGAIANIVTAVTGIIGLFKKQKQTDVTYWLKLIWEDMRGVFNTVSVMMEQMVYWDTAIWEIRDNIRFQSGVIDAIKDIGFGLAKKADIRNKLLKGIRNGLENLSALGAPGPTGGAGGFGGTAPELPIEPPTIPGVPSVGTKIIRKRIEINVRNVFRFEGQIDPFWTQKIVRDQIIPAILDALDTKRYTRRFKEKLDID